MVRLLITGDLHYRSANPRARIDEFRIALAVKMREVFDLAAERRADAIVIPGDICDSPNMSYSTFAELGKLLSQAPCSIWSIPGNHDMFGSNPETLRRTPFGALVELGIVRDLSCDPFERSESDDPRPLVGMVGNPFSAETDLGITDYLFCSGLGGPGGSRHRVRIQVAHGMLLERTPNYELRHTLVSDVATHPAAPDVLIVGHEHTGFGVLRVPRKHCPNWPMLAINPGALCRLTAHPAEIERTVQVCLLTVERAPEDEDETGFFQPRIETELIPLKSAKPGHEVLSREHLEAQAEREEKVAAFLALLAEEGETRFLEVREIIEDIARREAVPREVVDEALRRIGAAREALAKGGTA